LRKTRPTRSNPPSNLPRAALPPRAASADSGAKLDYSIGAAGPLSRPHLFTSPRCPCKTAASLNPCENSIQTSRDSSPRKARNALARRRPRLGRGILELGE
jgi:hypothetical protein